MVANLEKIDYRTENNEQFLCMSSSSLCHESSFSTKISYFLLPLDTPWTPAGVQHIPLYNCWVNNCVMPGTTTILRENLFLTFPLISLLTFYLKIFFSRVFNFYWVLIDIIYNLTAEWWGLKFSYIFLCSLSTTSVERTKKL